MANPVDTVVRARIDAETKAAASVALQEMGLSISDYIRMALVRVAHDKAVPFAVYAPGKALGEPMITVSTGKDCHDER